MKEFKNQWKKKYPKQGCTILISFQDDEIGKFATFSFHKNRTGETIIDKNIINNFLQPIYLEIIEG